MNNILRKYLKNEVSIESVKEELGNDLYNVKNITPEKVCTEDIIFLITQFIIERISKEELLQLVNTVWFTDLYEYNSEQENAIASVMTLLESLDETCYTNEDFENMIDCLIENTECNL